MLSYFFVYSNHILLFFNLDVAIVLIITMVAKIYFPESLERTIPTKTSPRSYNYRRVSMDVDDKSTISADNESHNNNNNTNNNNDDTKNNDDDNIGGMYESDWSHDEDFQFIAEQQALVEGDLAPIGSTKRLIGRTPTEAAGTNRFNHFSFEQENTSKTDVLKRLLICVISLNVTFIIWGVLQERMLTRRYPRFTGEFFTYSYALVFTNRFWTLIMSTFLMMYFKPRRSCSTVIYEYSFPSISNMLSSWCQYESLRYVSFPAVTLFKSFKLAPVMAMGKFLGNKQCKFIKGNNRFVSGSYIIMLYQSDFSISLLMCVYNRSII